MCARTAPSSHGPALLLVAGEPSGDSIAGGIARALLPQGVRCFGMGGSACEQSGVELVADLRRSAAMGFTEVAARLPAVVSAYAKLASSARLERPRAAALVNYTEFNARLGRHLRRRRIPVLWCVAPQVWAWRRGRMRSISRALDRLAVILPFEERLWREAGVDAHYVGHPALDVVLPERVAARAELGLDRGTPCVALLPGSRAHEVTRHAAAMIGAVRELARRGTPVQARLIAAASLDAASRRRLGAIAAAAGVAVIDVAPGASAIPWLRAFDAALVTSGTATLESALAGAPPVIVYRMSPLSAALARRLIRTPFIGLPNILLGSRQYPELVQEQVEARRMAREVALVLERGDSFQASAEELRRRLAYSGQDASSRTSYERIARLAQEWLRPDELHEELPARVERA